MGTPCTDFRFCVCVWGKTLVKIFETTPEYTPVDLEVMVLGSRLIGRGSSGGGGGRSSETRGTRKETATCL